MDYRRVGDSINTLLRTAVPEGGSTSKYDKIPLVDDGREIIVSHIKSTYTTETGEMINGKEVIDTANTYKNMIKSSEGELEEIKLKAKTLEAEIVKEKEHVKSSKQTNTILQILFWTIVVVIANYSIGGSWVHGIGFLVLIIGFGFALYSRGEIQVTDFSSFKQWISTTLGL
jgi:hypothetical protein